MAFDSYSGPTEKFNGIPVKGLRFFQLREQQDVKMGELKMVVDDIKTVITHFLNLSNESGETVQLNGVDAGDSPSHILNFVDGGGAAWTVTQDPETGAYSISVVVSGSGSTPAGSTTEIQYNNAGAFGADSGFTRTSAKVTIAGDGTGTDGALHIIEGDVVSQYIVLEEEAGRPGEAYLTFKGTTANAAAMGVIFVAGSPDKYIFTDPSATPLLTINIGTQKVTIRDLGGIGTRMVVADSVGVLSTQAIPTGTGTVTSVAMTVPTGLSISGSPITTSGTLALSLTAGYVIPTTTEETNWNTAYTNRIISLTTTGSGAATLIANVLNIPTPSAATFVSLTVTGSSGSATLIAGVLNIPTYTLAGLGGLTNVLASTNIFVGNGSNVATAVAMSGDATLANTGALTIANDAVTYAKMQNVSATSRLLGRTTAGSGDVEEVVLDPDGTLAANSDIIVASQKAVKTYVDGKFVFAKNSATQTLAASTNNQAITNVSVAIAANKTMFIEIVLQVNASATNGWRVAVAIPTGATMNLAVNGQQSATSAYGTTSWLTTSGVVGATTGQSASMGGIISTTQQVRITGWVTTAGTSGTIDALAATANAANTVKIVTGSWIKGNYTN
jgi:hypothetical protein